MVDLIILRSPVGDLPTISLPKDRDFTLGRGRGADWFLETDGQISTLHLTIRAKDDHIEFKDHGSTNGTFLNEKRVSLGIAREGDQLRIGQTVFAIQVRTVTPTRESARDLPETPRAEAISQPRSIELRTPPGETRNINISESLTVGRTQHPNPNDAMWLEPNDSRYFPISVSRGCTYYIGRDCTQSASDVVARKSREVDNDTPILKLRWRGDFCEIWAVDPKAAILLNGLPLANDVLHVADRLQINNVNFVVHYQRTGKATTINNGASETFESFETAVEPTPTIKRKFALPDTEITQPKSATQFQDFVESKIDEMPQIKVPSEQIETVKQIPGDYVPAALAGPLPDGDPIAALLSLAEHASPWLMEIDSADAERFSLPFKVSKEDAAWMLNVQASWPKSNYLVAFSGESADQVFEEMVNLQARQNNRQLTYDHLTRWTKTEMGQSGKRLDFLLIEGPAATWVYLGSVESNPMVTKTLLEWAKS